MLRQDYVVAAVGKGLPTGYVLRRHVLRPASLGLANVIGLNVGALLSGTVVVELIFGIGGLGQELLESAINRDLYLLAGLTVYVVGIYVAIGLLVDLAMPRLDPRLGRP